ncbi:hypothetical protein CC78DRAFT_547925 [Lojkania enalia]|uniref:Uncharacterized protein n=1 Tax=Lojkania enalia TaxID=147567 RepID=A0A9P4N2M0_9PLEO|nr:hypothetical protein CC78DRAFT_547925 [Didymosphaeria enalia]
MGPAQSGSRQERPYWIFPNAICWFKRIEIEDLPSIGLVDAGYSDPPSSDDRSGESSRKPPASYEDRPVSSSKTSNSGILGGGNGLISGHTNDHSDGHINNHRNFSVDGERASSEGSQSPPSLTEDSYSSDYEMSIGPPENGTYGRTNGRFEHASSCTMDLIEQYSQSKFCKAIQPLVLKLVLSLAPNSQIETKAIEAKDLEELESIYDISFSSQHHEDSPDSEGSAHKDLSSLLAIPNSNPSLDESIGKRVEVARPGSKNYVDSAVEDD